MHAVASSYLIRNPTKGNRDGAKWLARAEAAVARGGTLHVTEKARIELTRAFAVRTDDRMIGSAWHTFTPKRHEPVKWSKAMAVYMNSTVGILGLLGSRTFKSLAYPRWGVGDVRDVPVPDFGGKSLAELASVYDGLADSDLGLLSDPSSTRCQIDSAVGGVLGLSADLVSHARIELSKEPMVTKKRHGSGALA